MSNDAFSHRFFLFVSLLSLITVQIRSVSSFEIRSSLNGTQKVIFIADPGVDDAAAILMALAHPDIEVLAVLSNFGIVLT